jgi:pimeloyl-ACP methyl ester carboxylesterase
VAVAMTLLFTFWESSAAQASEGYKPPGCHDNSPHKIQMITVAPEVNLEVLDWGGSGEAMVLLPGLGDNAHVYDEFAAQFTDYFHVIGITRRGYPPSSIPQEGYDVQTRVSDDIAVLDALAIDKAVLVGHSLAASEVSALAETHKDRVDKLVYLDAYDLSERNEFPGPPGPDSLYTDADTKSLWSCLAGRVAELVEIGVAASPAERGYRFRQQGQCIERLVSR